MFLCITKKTLFLEFRKLRNWRRWMVAAGQVVAGGQMVARGRVVAGGHSEKIQNFIKKGTGQQYFACTWVQDSRIVLSA